jgi:hypothetical protein
MTMASDARPQSKIPGPPPRGPGKLMHDLIRGLSAAANSISLFQGEPS